MSLASSQIVYDFWFTSIWMNLIYIHSKWRMHTCLWKMGISWLEYLEVGCGSCFEVANGLKICRWLLVLFIVLIMPMLLLDPHRFLCNNISWKCLVVLAHFFENNYKQCFFLLFVLVYYTRKVWNLLLLWVMFAGFLTPVDFYLSLWELIALCEAIHGEKNIV